MNIEMARSQGELEEQPSTPVAQDAGQIIIKTVCSDNLDVILSTVWHILGKEGDILDQFSLICSSSTSSTASSSSSADRLGLSLDPTGPTATEVAFSIIEAMKEGSWDKVKTFLDNVILLINTDTGGQAEFLDLHAALVQGPSFNLLFSRLTDELDRPFKIHFTNKEGKSTEQEDSTMTVEEVLFQALSSIACFSSSCPDGDEVSSDTEASNSFARYSKSKVMFVGTHRDLVSEKEFVQTSS